MRGFTVHPPSLLCFQSRLETQVLISFYKVLGVIFSWKRNNKVFMSDEVTSDVFTPMTFSYSYSYTIGKGKLFHQIRISLNTINVNISSIFRSRKRHPGCEIRGKYSLSF